MTIPPDIRRIQRGRGHSYTIGGQPVMGVTTILKKGLPMPALVGWAAREVAQAVVDRRDILMDFSDAEVMDFLRGAPGRVRDAAANRGTEVHALAQRLARGEEVDVPEEIAGHVDAYLRFLDRWKLSDALVERPCFSRFFRYGGTFDLQATNHQGQRCLFDLKTSGSGVYGEVALQLAAYGHAEVYLDDEGLEQKMPETQLYAAVWLRDGEYDVYPIDVTDREFAVFRYVQQVAHWLENRERMVKGEAMA